MSTLPVSERAVIQRLNRALKSRGLKVIRFRGEPAIHCVVIDYKKGEVHDRIKRGKLETYAREAGALKSWERLK